MYSKKYGYTREQAVKACVMNMLYNTWYAVESAVNSAFLQKTLKNMRYVPSTDSLIFIGSKETLSKIQELIQKLIDRFGCH